MASFRFVCGEALGIGVDFCVVLVISDEEHDVGTVKAVKLQQMVLVEADIIGVDMTDAVMPEPGAQTTPDLRTGAEAGLRRRIQKQSVVIHATALILSGQDVVLYFHRRKGVRIGNHGADGHDLVCPVGFGINDGNSLIHALLGGLMDSISKDVEVCNACFLC